MYLYVFIDVSFVKSSPQTHAHWKLQEANYISLHEAITVHRYPELDVQHFVDNIAAPVLRYAMKPLVRLADFNINIQNSSVADAILETHTSHSP